jgi:hypothetical protein
LLAYRKDPMGIYTTSRTLFIERAETYKNAFVLAIGALRELPHPNLAVSSPQRRRPDGPHSSTTQAVVIDPRTIEGRVDQYLSVELIRKDIVEIGGVHIVAKRITGQ